LTRYRRKERGLELRGFEVTVHEEEAILVDLVDVGLKQDENICDGGERNENEEICRFFI